MTTNDIDAIRKLADAADRAPWRAVEEHGRDIADEAYTRLTIQTDDPAGSIEIAEMVDPDHGWASQLPEENAAFLAAARTLVPDLCDEVEQLRADIDDRDSEISALKQDLDLQTKAAWGNNSKVAELTAELDKTRAALTASREQAATYANEIGALKAELERTRTDERNTIAADIENMPINLGDTGWKHLEQKADEASYPVEWVRRRRTRDDFTTATIEVAYQYGYRQAAKVARGEVAR